MTLFHHPVLNPVAALAWGICLLCSFSPNTFANDAVAKDAVAKDAAAKQVTTKRIFVASDYSASSPDTPALIGPYGEGSGASRGSLNGKTRAQSPASASLPVLEALDILPPPVRRMHAAIHEAALSGNLEALRLPIEMNELPPILGFGTGPGDPLDQVRAMISDTYEAELLAILAEILESDFVVVDQGTPQEMYVWPYFAHYPLSALNETQMVELFRLVTSADFDEMDALGHYTFFRLGIGPDGTWHYFVAGE